MNVMFMNLTLLSTLLAIIIIVPYITYKYFEKRLELSVEADIVLNDLLERKNEWKLFHEASRGIYITNFSINLNCKLIGCGPFGKSINDVFSNKELDLIFEKAEALYIYLKSDSARKELEIKYKEFYNFVNLERELQKLKEKENA